MDEMKFEAFVKNFKVGIEGEEDLRAYLKSQNHKFFQADCISFDPKAEKWYLWEAKHKERFKAPPFDGHGLPLVQIQARLQFYKDTGIRPILYIKDLHTKEIFVQAMDVLAKCDDSKKFVTKNRIIIFHLDCFVKLK